MAMPIPSPAPIPDDCLPLKDIAAFLSESGHHVSVSTLYRWIDRYQLRVVRRGRKNLLSTSAALRAQRDELDRRGE